MNPNNSHLFSNGWSFVSFVEESICLHEENGWWLKWNERSLTHITCPQCFSFQVNFVYVMNFKGFFLAFKSGHFLFAKTRAIWLPNPSFLGYPIGRASEKKSKSIKIKVNVIFIFYFFLWYLASIWWVHNHHAWHFGKHNVHVYKQFVFQNAPTRFICSRTYFKIH
jgi:hypothetical protein